MTRAPRKRTGSSWLAARWGSWLRSARRVWEWKPSAPTSRAPVADVESEKCAVIADSASLVVKEVRALDHYHV